MKIHLTQERMSFFHLQLIQRVIQLQVTTQQKLRLKEPTCAQMVSLTANMKMEQALLSRMFKQILKRSVMTMSCFSTSQVFQGLEQ